MKAFKYLTILFIVLVSAISCEQDVKIEYVPELEPGSELLAVMVSPSEKRIYADSSFPTMRAFTVPEDAKDTALVWSSSNENVLKVDPRTGELSWGTIQNSVVTITATNPQTGISGSSTFEVRNEFGQYKYIDVTRELGFWILDRNVGASVPGDSWAEGTQKSAGDYFHFNFSTPVANREFGGPDGKGGLHPVAGYSFSGWDIPGGYPAYNRYWTGYAPEAADWTDPAQTPCPRGWRLPTREEFENIIYKTNPENYATAQEKGAAKVLFKKVQLSAGGFMLLGMGWMEGGSVVLWSSTRNEDTKKIACLFVNVYPLSKGTREYVVGQIREYSYPWNGLSGISMPIRCVRSITPEIPD